MIVTIPFTFINTINPRGVGTGTYRVYKYGPYKWTVPEGVTSVTVECFGGGGYNTATGAAYSKSNLTVTADTVLWVLPGYFLLESDLITYPFGTPNSWVRINANTEPFAISSNTDTAVKACSCYVPPASQISLGIGQVKYRGGSGGTGYSISNYYGGETGTITDYWYGGAGGAAGPNGNGGNGYPTTGETYGGGGGANGGADATGTAGGFGRFANLIGSGGSGTTGAVAFGYADYVANTTLPVTVYQSIASDATISSTTSTLLSVIGGRSGGKNIPSAYYTGSTAIAQGYGAVLISFTKPNFVAVFGIENGAGSYYDRFYNGYGYYGYRTNTWAFTDTWITLPSDVSNVIVAECFTGTDNTGGGSYSRSNINVSPNQRIFIGGLSGQRTGSPFSTYYGYATSGTYVNTLSTSIPTEANGTIRGCYAAGGDVNTQEARSVGLVKYRGGAPGYTLYETFAGWGESGPSTTYYYGGRGGMAGPNGRGGNGSPAQGTYPNIFPGAGGGANGGGDAVGVTPGRNRANTFGPGSGQAPFNIGLDGGGRSTIPYIANAEALVYSDSAFGNTTVLLFGGSGGFASDYSDYDRVGTPGYSPYSKVVLTYTSTSSGQVQQMTYSYAYIID
jgi:hypothetical protein